jgi:hypothetical protein
MQPRTLEQMGVGVRERLLCRAAREHSSTVPVVANGGGDGCHRTAMRAKDTERKIDR